MDEIVLRSMLKWPDVPAVYGWLSLDRRGNWMIKTVAGRFERIAHAAVREFIGRNYASDRSEEHTSELQSRLHLVCRLLLEKKKKTTKPRLICTTTFESTQRIRV